MCFVMFLIKNTLIQFCYDIMKVHNDTLCRNGDVNEEENY
jgi:hypothetical protein